MKYNFSLVCLCALSVLLGCSPAVRYPAPIAELELQDDYSDIAPPYRIGIGDEMEIKFFTTPELNEKVQVQPDGMISIMFAQDIKAYGKTPAELAKAIKKKIAPHVRQADLVVVMHGFASQRIYVAGEVARPGQVQLIGRETLTQALDEAGWITPSGRLDEIALVRRRGGGREAVYSLDIGKVFSGEDTSQDVLVQAGDVILVPPLDAVSFDRWIDRSIRQALPFSTSAGAVYTNQYQAGSSR